MVNQQVEPSNDDKDDTTGAKSGDLTIFEIISSSMAAALGVQSKENKIRDFERGKPHQFIIAGVVFTLLFLVGMIVLVNMIV